MFPFISPLRVQQALTEGAVHAMETMASDAMKVMHGQDVLMHDHNEHRRSDDDHGHPKKVFSGADLLDHYGRRRHDVDVEHSI